MFTVRFFKPHISCPKRESFLFSFQTVLRLKMSFPSRIYLCVICSEYFGTPQELKQHERTRHPPDERPYKCSKCDKTFSVQSVLEMHERLAHHSVWTGENPVKSDQSTSIPKMTELFSCTQCGKSFPRSNDLSLHKMYSPRCSSSLEGFHNTGETPARKKSHESQDKSCTQCGKIHTKPYKCPECHMSFSYPDKLKKHDKSHRYR